MLSKLRRNTTDTKLDYLSEYHKRNLCFDVSWDNYSSINLSILKVCVNSGWFGKSPCRLIDGFERIGLHLVRKPHQSWHQTCFSTCKRACVHLEYFKHTLVYNIIYQPVMLLAGRKMKPRSINFKIGFL